MTPVRVSKSADRWSTTSTMPNGAGQLPGRYTPIDAAWPWVRTHSSRQTAITRPEKVDSRFSLALMCLCFSPSSNIIAAVISGSRMGATIS